MVIVFIFTLFILLCFLESLYIVAVYRTVMIIVSCTPSSETFRLGLSILLIKVSPCQATGVLPAICRYVRKASLQEP
jgi:hypothetical protein